MRLWISFKSVLPGIFWHCPSFGKEVSHDYFQVETEIQIPYAASHTRRITYYCWLGMWISVTHMASIDTTAVSASLPLGVSDSHDSFLGFVLTPSPWLWGGVPPDWEVRVEVQFPYESWLILPSQPSLKPPGGGIEMPDYIHTRLEVYILHSAITAVGGSKSRVFSMVFGWSRVVIV